jgi:hypothetical protein
MQTVQLGPAMPSWVVGTEYPFLGWELPVQEISSETNSTALSAHTRFRAALLLAMAADALQLFVLPLFAEGAFSPADDLLDILVAIVLVRLLGFHWEFLPAFAGELIPGVDLVPFWSLAVANVYRKWKVANIDTVTADNHLVLEGK